MDLDVLIVRMREAPARRIESLLDPRGARCQRGGARGSAAAEELLELDAAAAETWAGSGESMKQFSDALGALVPSRRKAQLEMTTLNLGQPQPDWKLAPPADSSAQRNQSRGDEAVAKDVLPRGEELLERISGRVYEILMEDLEQSFDAR